MSRAQVELRESVLELSAESAELVECLAKDAVGLVGLVRLAGLVGHHQIKMKMQRFKLQTNAYQRSNKDVTNYILSHKEQYFWNYGKCVFG